MAPFFCVPAAASNPPPPKKIDPQRLRVEALCCRSLKASNSARWPRRVMSSVSGEERHGLRAQSRQLTAGTRFFCVRSLGSGSERRAEHAEALDRNVGS